MVKLKTLYTCQSCGYQTPKWLGRCPDCQDWNSLLEEKISPVQTKVSGITLLSPHPPQPISEIVINAEDRLTTGISELDRVLGGGAVAGSVILIGGDPGIGKSTLLLQGLNQIAAKGNLVLYVSGEESPKQTRMRGERIGATSDHLLIYAENSLEMVLENVKKLNPKVLVIDSVQTLFSSEIQSTPGSLSQIREITARLVLLAKRIDLTVFLVGHVTKEGAIAGPRVLEHMVDAVLYFEGNGGGNYRILRAVKNRFGSTNEIGVFEMRDTGLKEVIDPSCLFLSERARDVSGSVVVPSIEGTRPILVEIQALVSHNPFGIPRRTVLGVDSNKVSILVAVLEKKAKLKLLNHDIFLKVGGGMRINEPAVDLGIVASMASNFLDKPVGSETVVFGEVGLTGEVRGISYGEMRVKEAGKLGFKKCILPRETERALRNNKRLKGIKLQGVSTVKEVLNLLF
ncbi:MAG: DNA repair protein RadA [Thermodesulfobacteriota bacterium]